MWDTHHAFGRASGDDHSSVGQSVQALDGLLALFNIPARCATIQRNKQIKKTIIELQINTTSKSCLGGGGTKDYVVATEVKCSGGLEANAAGGARHHRYLSAFELHLLLFHFFNRPLLTPANILLSSALSISSRKNFKLFSFFIYLFVSITPLFFFC
jgi:hypothetical protein